MHEAGLDNSDTGIMIRGQYINNLRYANDTTLASGASEDLKEIIRSVKTASEKFGLHLNVSKTKILSNVPLGSFTVDGVDIEVVHNFNFLGSTISEDENSIRQSGYERIAKSL